MSSQEFSPVPLSELISSFYLVSDIYVKMPSGKHVRVAKKGEAVDASRFQKYKDKQTEFMYVTSADFMLYSDFANKASLGTRKSESITGARRFELYMKTMETIIGEGFTKSIDPSVISVVQQTVETALDLIAEDPTLLDLVIDMEEFSQKLYAHCVATSLLSCILAQSLGWEQKSTMMTLALAGLFHDIGLRDVDEKLVYADPATLTVSQANLITTHPQRGREILLQVMKLPEGVAQVAYEHEEMWNGSGYPQGIAGERTMPMSRLVSLVDHFCELTAPITEGGMALTSHDAIQRIKVHHEQEFDKTFVDALSKLIIKK